MQYRATIDRRSRFLEIDGTTVAALERIKESLDARMDEHLDKFYAHVHEQPELLALFSDDESMARARAAQKRYWLTHLFAKHFDQDQFEQAEKIAQAHLRVGLDPSSYMDGYCYMLNEFVDLAFACHAGDANQAAAAIRALNKLVFLDMNTVIDCYLEAKNETMRELLRRATSFADDMTALSGRLDEACSELRAKAGASPDGEALARSVASMSAGVADLASRLHRFNAQDRLRIEERPRDDHGVLARLRRMIDRKP